MGRKKTFLAYLLASLLPVLCLAGCALSRPLKLPAWNTFKAEMLAKYNFRISLQAELRPSSLFVDCYCQEMPDDAGQALLTDLTEFLSSDRFLQEYLPFIKFRVSKQAEGSPEPEFAHMPDIDIQCFQGKERMWWANSCYYAGGRYVDEQTEIDMYQTWSYLPDGGTWTTLDRTEAAG